MTALDCIAVDGYKSIRSAKIDLGPINVLIGANGAGKSNLLGLFGLLADLADDRLQLHVGRQGGADAILHFGRKKTQALRISLRFGLYAYTSVLVSSAGDTLVFEDEVVWPAPPGPRFEAAPPGVFTLDEDALRATGVAIGSGGHKETGLSSVRDSQGHSEIARLVAATMRGWRRFHFHDTGASAPMKQKRKLDDNRALRTEGDNLAPFLFSLKASAPSSYRRIVEAVRAVAPFFDDFSLAPDAVNPDVIQLAWRHKTDDALFTADALSDGTLRFICLATLLLQPELPSLIVIDEPELGLHPFAITQLAALVRSAATRSQVLLATQSVTLLDQFNADEVIVAERSNGESTFRRLDDQALDEWRQEYSLGELWLKNVLGGRPR